MQNYEAHGATKLVRMNQFYLDELIDQLLCSANFLELGNGVSRGLLKIEENRKENFAAQSMDIPLCELKRFKQCLKDPSSYLIDALLPHQGRLMEKFNVAFSRVHLFVCTVSVSLIASSYMFLASLVEISKSSMPDAYLVSVILFGFLITLSLLFPLFVALFSWPVLRPNWLLKYQELLDYAIDKRNNLIPVMHREYFEEGPSDTAYARVIH